MKKIILLITILTTTLIAKAENMNEEVSGTYGTGFSAFLNQPVPPGENTYSVRVRGNRAVLVDNKHNIKYTADLNNPKEQDLPKEYLDYLARKLGTKAIGRATISNTKVTDGGNRVSTTINYHIGYNSPFGQIELIRASVPFTATLVKGCKLNEFFPEIESCIEIKKGFGAGITQVKTNLGRAADGAIGIVLDLILKFSYSGVDMAQPLAAKIKQ